MKKALAGVLALALAGVMVGSAVAQVPNVQVYFDPNFTQTQAQCPVPPPANPVELYVVMNNWNMLVGAVDFRVNYPPSLIWLADIVPDAYSSTIGFSPTGVAVAWNIAQFGFAPLLALKPFVMWGVCDCADGPQAIVVDGYGPYDGLGNPVPGAKVVPTATRWGDFELFNGVGMTSLICPGIIATESATWGEIKALYR